MNQTVMKANKLKQLGIPVGPVMNIAMKAVAAAGKSSDYPHGCKSVIEQLVKHPETLLTNVHFGELAAALLSGKKTPYQAVRAGSIAPHTIWGEGFEPEALEQLHNACSLPVAVRAALMPDAHVGYGLPIGGVLAAKNAVIPFAVGVDIACRMKLSVLDIPVTILQTDPARLKLALMRETAFGVGTEFRDRKYHPVMDDDWSRSPVTRQHKDKAWRQLGTSGSGNHFVEFGILTVDRTDFSLAPGIYLALLSHSGSRGTGNEVARYYSAIAQKQCSGLPDTLRHLSWLDMNSEVGQEYWQTMKLMGHYAAANHALIHTAVAKSIGAEVQLDIENHHNFAWKEEYNGETVIVHRKGATPAAAGTLGIIPGSMATPGYIVRGRGNPASLNSASHGAGRCMSRTAAKKKFTWNNARTLLAERGVTLLSAGLDEVPMAYKDIESVMAAQRDLVEPLARFDPRIVRMSPDGERAED